MTDALGELVSCESPSTDEAETRRCCELAAELVHARLGARPEWLESAGRTHVRWTWGRPRVLLLGHLDTVWPSGTLARWPFSVDGDVATGPGVFDMKAGVVQALAALTLMPSLEGVSLLLTVDEELGSPTSRDLVVASAHGCDAVLVCEPSQGGALKTARKGIALYDVDITGRAAHAGLEPERGVNAGVALAHAVLGAAQLTDIVKGTTVVPTASSAGTTSNTVPAAATVSLDVRSWELGELQRVDASLRDLAARVEAAVPGSLVQLSGGVNRKPLAPDASEALLAVAREVAEELGLPRPMGVAVGGGSDGNLTAGAGFPTLDGLGAVGQGAHAEGEYVLLSELWPRAQLLAGLVRRVLQQAPAGSP